MIGARLLVWSIVGKYFIHSRETERTIVSMHHAWFGKKNTLMVTEFGLHYNAVVFQGINFMDTNKNTCEFQYKDES